MMNRGSMSSPPTGWIVIGVLVLVSLYVLFNSQSASTTSSSSSQENNARVVKQKIEPFEIEFDEEKLRQEVKKMEEKRYASLLASDAGTLRKVFGDDLVYIHSNGGVDSKESYVSVIDSGVLKYQEFTVEESTVRIVSADTAVVTGSAKVVALNRNNEVRISLRFTNVWILRSGGWENVLWQATPIK